MSIDRQECRSWPVGQPIVAVLLASLFIRVFDVDRIVAAWSYDPNTNDWPFYRAEPWLSFYRYGTYPPILVGVGGVIVALCGRWLVPLNASLGMRAIRLRGLFLALLLVIGPGLVVEACLKTLWGRPRPMQCQEFGGEMTFVPLGAWGEHRFPNSSFPSGHAAAAFFLMGLGFVTVSDRPHARWYWFFAGMAYGLAMGATRVLQGGHFLSDVLWAGAIVYLVAVMLNRLMIRIIRL